MGSKYCANFCAGLRPAAAATTGCPATGAAAAAATVALAVAAVAETLLVTAGDDAGLLVTATVTEGAVGEPAVVALTSTFGAEVDVAGGAGAGATLAGACVTVLAIPAEA